MVDPVLARERKSLKLIGLEGRGSEEKMENWKWNGGNGANKEQPRQKQ